MTDTHLRVDRPSDGVVLLTLDNPDQRNAMSAPMTAAWEQTIAGLCPARRQQPIRRGLSEHHADQERPVEPDRHLGVAADQRDAPLRAGRYQLIEQLAHEVRGRGAIRQ